MLQIQDAAFALRIILTCQMIENNEIVALQKIFSERASKHQKESKWIFSSGDILIDFEYFV